MLPFSNLSDDPEQEYFSDGLTNDIITDLSRFSTLFVIAANSTFRYKGKPVKVQDVARELGVRYVVEGGVQRLGDKLRISAQLIDATTGHHVWAERYDRDAQDFFAVQNEMTRTIVGTISPIGEGRGKLGKAEIERIMRTPTQNLQAYDYFQHAVVLSEKFTEKDTLRARELYEKATELDPTYARAIARNAWTYLIEYKFRWSDTPEKSIDQAMELAERALAVDENEPFAHWAKASVFTFRRQTDLAIQAYEMAYRLNPNDAQIVTEYGWGLTLARRPEEGIPLMEQAMRLNPYYPGWFAYNLWYGYYLTGQHEKALDTIYRIKQPGASDYAVMAVSFVNLGRIEESNGALRKALELKSLEELESWAKNRPFKYLEDLDRFLEDLGRAGLLE